MARRIVIECDKCHKEIGGNPIVLTMERIDRETGELIIGDITNDRTFELCDSCADRLVGWITGQDPAAAVKTTEAFAAAVSEPEEEHPCGMAIADADIQQYEKPKTTIVFATADNEAEDVGDVEAAEELKEPKKPKKRDMQIDHDKIRALHNAGWKPKDIAGNMSLDIKQVYNSLNKHK